ncbi:aminotransferase class I/II-fold pyridoxal phosphate-dependent enzyme [Glaciecola petra]|uniref:8-amino-7-oxononanoate synthase n=1 Tax=Glaciecola petra TaxID=3075602 RepID=A0ABU2ZPV9_9ALTE|nr:8-amino-7-oxononanoate synthase [Aestuariibacter sp. P117]MDT0594640.1 8-amino-7-oxononanoate synthase [Aestuariibacter sp. P117]
MSFEHLARDIDKRKAEHLLRVRTPVTINQGALIQINDTFYLNFASNDYLGLSQDISVLQSYTEGLSEFGASSSASSVLSGYSIEHEKLESVLCSALNKPAAMLFTSGFAANHALCQALSPDNSPAYIVCDKYMHASFIQGAIDASAMLKRFKHNNMAHAQMHLENVPPAMHNNSLLATEGVFSMDGDYGDIAALSKLASQTAHSADHLNNPLNSKSLAIKPWLMVDDAHAFGVLGTNGYGSLDLPIARQSEAKNTPANIDILMGTFGKAVGTSGAFIAGSKSLIDYMVNNAKHYVYSTAISAATAKATRQSLALIKAGQQRERLHQNISLFKRLCDERGIELMASDSAIQCLVVGCPVAALEMSQRLADLGLWVPAIRTPTVPKNTDRLRITLSALHQSKDVSALVDALSICIPECIHT